MGALATIRTDADLMAEMRCRARQGSVRELASLTGISTSHLYGILNGNAKLTQPTRSQILDVIRMEDLALADKIVAEMRIPTPPPPEEAARYTLPSPRVWCDQCQSKVYADEAMMCRDAFCSIRAAGA